MIDALAALLGVFTPEQDEAFRKKLTDSVYLSRRAILGKERPPEWMRGSKMVVTISFSHTKKLPIQQSFEVLL